MPLEVELFFRKYLHKNKKENRSFSLAGIILFLFIL
jgi:hypothetical protein